MSLRSRAMFFVAGAHGHARALFVLPVRGHAQLGVFMHLPGADLNLDGFAARPQHHGVDRLVAVGFRVGDVVVELVRQMAEVGMHDAQRRIAILQAPATMRTARSNKFVRTPCFFCILRQMLMCVSAGRDLPRNAFAGYLGAQPSDEIVDELFAIDAALMQQLGDALVFFRMQVAEAILQLHFSWPMPSRLASGA